MLGSYFDKCYVKTFHDFKFGLLFFPLNYCNNLVYFSLFVMLRLHLNQLQQ